MCGIPGLALRPGATVHDQDLRRLVDGLMLLSESRGKEASGLAVRTAGGIQVIKQPDRASVLIKTERYRSALRTAAEAREPVAIVCHARLVTNGSLELNANNQPVIKDGAVAVHNGIIVNDAELWQRFPQLHRQYEVDTEVLLALIQMFRGQGLSVEAAIREAFGHIRGTASVAVVFDDLPLLALATNNGSLYVAQNAGGGVVLFASETLTLRELLRRPEAEQLGPWTTTQLVPNTLCLVNLSDLSVRFLPFAEAAQAASVPSGSRVAITDRSAPEVARPLRLGPRLDVARFARLHRADVEQVRQLRRCNRCTLPSTMPFVDLDGEGVCRYCRSYRPVSYRGAAALAAAVEPYRRPGRADCIVCLSGGRDSSYALHYVREVLGLTPVALTYDWGMITDLGRRNQARMCGALGVEHILVSADIRRKRSNIRRNVEAWLRQPSLGTVPLFMAGDKQYFYHINRLRRELGIDLVIYAENPLEKTDFKSGFAGVPPAFNIGHGYNLGLRRKLRLGLHYAGAYLANPRYLNRSLADTFSAYLASYFIPHAYLFLYQYLAWDEAEVNQTLRQRYDWELAPDTASTWRIGDGTAPFYNYIYYTAAGVTENDTFRSNQVREGALQRQEALSLSERDNQPRYESMQWYFDTIGVDINAALAAVHAMPKRYR